MAYLDRHGKQISLIHDAAFLKELSQDTNRIYRVKIVILDWNEIPIRSIEGRVQSGSISINGSSSVRRTGSIVFVAESAENDLTDIDNLLSLNKKIQILIGLDNHVDTTYYDDIIWFKQGIFVITQPQLSHQLTGVTISLSFKDKMCLLNGECGGALPSSITFSEYDQVIGEYQYISTSNLTDALNDLLDKLGDKINNYTVYQVYYYGSTDPYYCTYNPDTNLWSEASESQIGEKLTLSNTIYDIIQTLVVNYGNENIGNVIINGLAQEVKNIVRYSGSETIYYSAASHTYTTEIINEDSSTIHYNDDCGYIYTSFTYPGDLISSLGDNVCTILDKIKSTLGNYEYYYDIDGKFVFQEQKNYLNTTYDPVQTLDENGFLLNEDSYFIDFTNCSESIYTFESGNNLISSYSNSPSYLNIKNDFHVWGENSDGYPIHYHVAIKSKPTEGYDYSESELTSYKVAFDVDSDGDTQNSLHITEDENEDKYTVMLNRNGIEGAELDWRFVLYLQGIIKVNSNKRPDVYEQELIDLFPTICDFEIINNKIAAVYKEDIYQSNSLMYWIDFIEPVGRIGQISVDNIGMRSFTYEETKIKKIYDNIVPDFILINNAANDALKNNLRTKCVDQSQNYSYVSDAIYNSMSLGTVGYSAYETARDLLHTYTEFNAGINISSIPIYYLEPNNRITVMDRAAGIAGDYVISSISLPLDGKSNMSISASKVINRL